MQAYTLPRTEYQRRLVQRREGAEKWSRRDTLIVNLRLPVFVALLALLGLALKVEAFALAWAAVPATVFLVLVMVHDHTLKRLAGARRAISFYENGLARVGDDWSGKGATGEVFLDPEHPYAADLDLFGPGSLFELLCTARTHFGEETLAGWLTHSAPRSEVLARQAAVAELESQLDFREDLALVGNAVRLTVRRERLSRWANGSKGLPRVAWLVLSLILAGAAAVTLIGWATWGFGPLPFLGVLSAQGLVRLFLKKRVSEVNAVAEEPARQLWVLQEILQRLESVEAESPMLQSLVFLVKGETLASVAIKRLHSYLSWLDSRKNQLFAPVAYVLMWPVLFAYALEGWRRRYGPLIGEWLQAVGSVEALCALAAYSYEHPDTSVPEVVEGQEALFEATDLGHPLLPASARVTNDVALNSETQAWVISGSNMSGKSTLLRTVGVNVVMALAGGNVCASRSRLSRLQLGATLRIQDSLQSGTSRFYAEVIRLKQLLDIAQGEIPLFFLLDEVLAGTNSHDRRVGAFAYVNSLLKLGAIGLVTTHDLALGELEEESQGLVSNRHFMDEFRDNKLVFDYTLRRGIVRKSNALELMRSIGLDV